MDHRVRRARPWLALTASLAIVAAACGSSSTSPAPSAGTPSSGAASSPPAASEAAPSAASAGTGVVSIGYESDIQYFDPALAYDTTSWTAGRLLYDQLVEYDSGTNLVPGLAAEMPTISADGLTYTFSLRPGIKFYKADGSVLRDVTADDVVFSLNRILDPNLKPNPSPVGPAFFSIIEGAQDVLDGKTPTASGLKAVDASTVEIKLAKPDKRLLNILAMQFGSVIPAESGLDATAFGKAPIGTGPYHLASYQQGSLATFTANQDYWGTPAKNGGVEIRIGIDPNTQLQQAQANQLDLMGDQLPAGAFTATVNDPTLKDRILRRTDVALFYVTMDTSGPNKALANVKVRQAINHAIDKENLVKVQNGRGGPINCILPPNMPGFDPTCNPYPYDVEKAKALMTEAGFGDGFKTQIYTDTTDLSKAMVESIQQDLSKLGITAEIVQQEWSVLLGTISTPHEAPMVYVGWFQDFPDPSDFIDPILSCASAVAGGANASWYCNEANDALSAQALSEQDDATRLTMYQDLQKKIMADAPWVPGTLSETVVLSSDRVIGFNPLHPVYPFDLRNVTVTE